MRGFRSLQLIPGCVDFSASLLDQRGGSRDVVGHLRDFEFREELPFPDPVAQVDLDRSEIACDFRHHIDLLKRLKLGCQHRLPGDGGSLYACHGDDGERARCPPRSSPESGLPNASRMSG